MTSKTTSLKLFFILLLFQTSKCSDCWEKQHLSKLRGNYKNVVNFQAGAIISTRKSNYFEGGFDNGLMLRDAIYTVTGMSGMTSSYRAISIEVVLLQNYQLNTLIVWLWDLESTRFYDFVIYAIFNNVGTKIYDQTSNRSVIIVKFTDQYVQSFKFYNRNGSNVNPILHFIKIEAFYKL